MYGISPVADTSYVDPIVPPQMNACVHCNSTEDDLLFSAQVFYQSGETNLQYISFVEYNNLILDTEDISLLDTFDKMLTILHQWKDVLHLQNKEEDNGVIDGPPSPYAPKGIPCNYDNEKAFMDQMQRCNKEVYHASMFRGELIKHLYPHYRMQD